MHIKNPEPGLILGVCWACDLEFVHLMVALCLKETLMRDFGSLHQEVYRLNLCCGNRGGGEGEEAQRRGRHFDWLLVLGLFVSEPLWIRHPLTHHISSPFNWTVTPRTTRPQAWGPWCPPCWTGARLRYLASSSQFDLAEKRKASQGNKEVTRFTSASWHKVEVTDVITAYCKAATPEETC